MNQKAKKLSLLTQLKNAQSPLSLPELVTLTANSIPERTLRRWLASWVEQGVIERTGQKRGTKYQLIESSPLFNDERYGQKNNDNGDSLLLNAVREPSGDNKNDTPPLLGTFPSDSYSIDHSFLKDIPKHRRTGLLEQIRDLWTHNSTALEGNTLTLGDTHAVLGMGLTVSGKPLREHQEIVGHAKAIDLLYQCLDRALTKEIIFDLHKAVQTDIVNDIFKPLGNWKVEVNGTYAMSYAANDTNKTEGKQVFIEYAHPLHVDSLMTLLIDYINGVDVTNIGLKNASECYAKIHMAFVHIHPFWDGNGRLARLLANIVLLKAGLPPLVIEKSQRREYIECLAEYQITVGQLKIGQLKAGSINENPELWPNEKALDPFIIFCENAYEATKTLIEEAKK